MNVIVPGNGDFLYCLALSTRKIIQKLEDPRVYIHVLSLEVMVNIMSDW